MCFRPADATSPGSTAICLGCGKIIQTMGGITLDSCPFCGGEIKPDTGTGGVDSQLKDPAPPEPFDPSLR